MGLPNFRRMKYGGIISAVSTDEKLPPMISITSHVYSDSPIMIRRMDGGFSITNGASTLAEAPLLLKGESDKEILQAIKMSMFECFYQFCKIAGELIYSPEDFHNQLFVGCGEQYGDLDQLLEYFYDRCITLTRRSLLKVKKRK